MRRRVRRLAGPMAMILLFVGGAAVAQTGGPTPSDRPVNCAVAAPETEGTDAVIVPGFCRLGMCRVQVSWEGAAVGAFGPGMPLPVHVYQQSDGSWVAGPNMNFAGMSFSDGFGRNGNGVAEALFGGGVTPDGTSWALYDDSELEDSPFFWSVVVNHADPAQPDMTGFRIYTCPSGYRTGPHWLPID